MDLNKITAIGTLLTGIAALTAVLGGFFTMRKQMQKSNTMNWLALFRTEYLNFSVYAAQLQKGITNEAIFEFNKYGLALRLLLSSKKPEQKALFEGVNRFWEFLNASDNSQEDYEREMKALHALAEKVIEQAEKSL